MAHHRNWRSRFDAVLVRALKNAVTPSDPAKATPQATASGFDPPPAGSDPGVPYLLLMRMEVLQLDPTRVKALMPADFRVLAHVCDYCQGASGIFSTSQLANRLSIR